MTAADDPGDDTREDSSGGEPDPDDDGALARLGRRRLLVGGTVAALGVAGAVGWRATRSRPVTVAGSLPLSGSLSAIGVPLRRGLQLFVERANERRGPVAPELRLRLVDDEGRPDAAREAYRSLVESADLLVAPYGSRATAAIVDLVEGAGVPCVAPTAGDRGLWADGRAWTVQLLNPVDTFLLPALAVARRTGLESVGFVYRSDGFTPTTMAGAIERARRGPWDLRAATVYGADDGMDEAMATVLERDPDLVVGGGFRPGAPGGGFLPDALALARAHRRAEGRARLACWSVGAAVPAFADRLGDRADGTMGVTGWKPYVGFPGNGAFVERYANRWEKPADAHAAQGYAAGQVLAAALDRADGRDPAGLRDALFALTTSTVFGRYRVDERGLQTGKGNAVVQWQDGSPVVVGPGRWSETRVEI
jgi:branched-chain amino acid transport system substrate-binding protein